MECRQEFDAKQQLNLPTMKRSHIICRMLVLSVVMLKSDWSLCACSYSSPNSFCATSFGTTKICLLVRAEL
ncbi:MAG: hypothetical protein RMK94_11530, partial [Armatimonadota bacterium]|nr:hypothetical protein [Armatimonadota bacterium]